MKRKVIFLDIDGVVNSGRSVIAYNKYPINNKSTRNFDMVAVGMIRSACKKCKAEIILSSTWRNEKDWENLGKTLRLPIVDKTPVCYGDNRTEEIRIWLEKNKVDEYVVVDDIIICMDNFIKVDPKNGLSYENYRDILNILGVESE
jgi:hypothetical protein